MKSNKMTHSIRLRYMIYKVGDKYAAICLETNIANRANTIEQLKKKIIDSTILYLRSFSEEEIQGRSYIRKAPLYYRIIWHTSTFTKPFVSKYRPDEAEFDTSSGKLSFA